MRMITVPTEELMEVIRLQLEQGGKANMSVTGSSMLPMLREHLDSVILAPCEGTLKSGDVALYRTEDGKYILHRIIRVTDTRYLFCGDNQAVPETVSKDRVLAVVTAYTKKGKLYHLNDLRYCIYRMLMVKCFGIRKYYIALRRRIGSYRRGR